MLVFVSGQKRALMTARLISTLTSLVEDSATTFNAMSLNSNSSESAYVDSDLYSFLGSDVDSCVVEKREATLRDAEWSVHLSLQRMGPHASEFTAGNVHLQPSHHRASTLRLRGGGDGCGGGHDCCGATHESESGGCCCGCADEPLRGTSATSEEVSPLIKKKRAYVKSGRYSKRAKAQSDISVDARGGVSMSLTSTRTFSCAPSHVLVARGPACCFAELIRPLVPKCGPIHKCRRTPIPC